MTGRSIMVAFALGALALAVGAGCGAAEATDAAAPIQTTSRASFVHGPSPLTMALATDQAMLGPTPSMSAQLSGPLSGQGALLGLTATLDSQPIKPISFDMGSADRREPPVSAGLVALPGSDQFRPIEMSIAGSAPDGLDFLLARRAGGYQGANGSATTRGAELRLGQRLRNAVTRPFQSPTSWNHPAWYVFAASDGTALVYTPTSDPLSPNRNLTTQDRVMVGSKQAGVSVEAYGMQASLSYVKRTVTTLDLIRYSASAEEEFTGVTFTWRH